MPEFKTNVTIVTHSLSFHSDDIFAVATLLLLLEKTDEVKVIRSRDKEIISKGDYVVDVGGINDPDTNRFDHHQEGGAGGRENGISYSSFGLVWKKFGQTLSGNKEIADKIDRKLVQPIDAIDNGIQIVETKIKDVYPYDIGDFFASLGPSWKEGVLRIDETFMQAVSYAQTILIREISKYKDELESSVIVEKIYLETVDKRLIIFDRYYGVSEYISKFPEPLFVVFPNNANDTWTLKAVRSGQGSFSNRKNLPKEWAGKGDEELEKVTGVLGSVFCHNGLFIAVAKTKEAILKLAELALNS